MSFGLVVCCHDTSEHRHNHFIFHFHYVFWQGVDPRSDFTGHGDGVLGIIQLLLKYQRTKDMLICEHNQADFQDILQKALKKKQPIAVRRGYKHLIISATNLAVILILRSDEVRR